MVLTLNQSALLRGWAQGLPMHVLALNYFDARSAAETRRQIEVLRVKLSEHAKRHGQKALAEALGASAKDWPHSMSFFRWAVRTVLRRACSPA